MLPQSKSINGIPWKKLQGKRLKLSAIRKSVSRPLNKPLCSSVLLEKQPTWYKKKCTPLSQEKQNLPCDQRELPAPFVPCCKTVCSMTLCRKRHSIFCPFSATSVRRQAAYGNSISLVWKWQEAPARQQMRKSFPLPSK